MTNPLYELTDMVEPKDGNTNNVRDPHVTPGRKLFNACLELLEKDNKYIKCIEYTICPIDTYVFGMAKFDYFDVNAKTGKTDPTPRDFELRGDVDAITIDVISNLRPGLNYNVLSYYEHGSYHWVTAVEINKRRQDLT